MRKSPLRSRTSNHTTPARLGIDDASPGSLPIHRSRLPPAALDPVSAIQNGFAVSAEIWR
jgi:hypothetical protein